MAQGGGGAAPGPSYQSFSDEGNNIFKVKTLTQKKFTVSPDTANMPVSHKARVLTASTSVSQEWPRSDTGWRQKLLAISPTGTLLI